MQNHKKLIKNKELKKYQLFWKRSPSPVFPPSGLGSASMYNRLETCGNHRGVLAPKKVDTATKLQKPRYNQRKLALKRVGFFLGNIINIIFVG